MDDEDENRLGSDIDPMTGNKIKPEETAAKPELRTQQSLPKITQAQFRAMRGELGSPEMGSQRPLKTLDFRGTMVLEDPGGGPAERYIDRINSVGPHFEINTYAVEGGPNMGLPNQSTSPEATMGYFMMGYRDGSGNHDVVGSIAIKTADRELVRQIQQALMQKIQELGSPREAVEWLVDDSEYSKMKVTNQQGKEESLLKE